MYYIIYQITNNVNGRIYIGKHKTQDLADGYMGSGKLIQKAIKKYGIDNFQKDILFVFASESEMNAKEKELVNENFVLSSDNYNITLGGSGGWDPVKSKIAFLGRKHTEEAKRKIGIASANRKYSDETKRKIVEHNKTHVKRKENISKALTGRRLSEETKQKISKAVKNNHANNVYKKIDGNGVGKGKSKPKITCPHCLKEGSPNNMFRWHFDNCSNPRRATKIHRNVMKLNVGDKIKLCKIIESTYRCDDWKTGVYEVVKIMPSIGQYHNAKNLRMSYYFKKCKPGGGYTQFSNGYSVESFDRMIDEGHAVIIFKNKEEII